jgi:hypothetical protein
MPPSLPPYLTAAQIAIIAGGSTGGAAALAVLAALLVWYARRRRNAIPIARTYVDMDAERGVGMSACARQPPRRCAPASAPAGASASAPPGAPAAAMAKDTEALPAGWRMVESKSRPGKFTYLNEKTGQRYEKLPREVRHAAKPKCSALTTSGEPSSGLMASRI